MKWLARLLRRAYLRHELHLFDTAMADEQRRRDEFADRMASWRYQRALLQSEYDRLRGDRAPTLRYEFTPKELKQ